MILKELQILSEALWESVKTDLELFSSISLFVKKLSETNFTNLNKSDLEEIKLYTHKIEEFFKKYRRTSMSGGYYIPPAGTSRNDSTVKRINEIVSELDKMTPENLEKETQLLKPTKNTQSTNSKGAVFIGHGRSKLWARVKLLLNDELEIDSFAFESETRTSESIIQVLEEFLSKSTFAIIIMTAEDETVEGKTRARQNVIHEIGLFQGRLGFNNVVLLKQDGTEDLSNLAGLQYIPFEKENIEQTFYELQRKLKKAGIITK